MAAGNGVGEATTNVCQISFRDAEMARLSDSMKLLSVSNSDREFPSLGSFNSCGVRDDCLRSCELEHPQPDKHYKNATTWSSKGPEEESDDDPRIVFNGREFSKREWNAKCVRLVFKQDVDGDTDLHVAIIQKQQQLATWFISLAPHPGWLNIPNRLLQTPLHVAVIVCDVAVVRSLVTSGSDVNARDVHGNTPLHIACREGYQSIVSCLLQKMVSACPLNDRQGTAYMYQVLSLDLGLSNYDGYDCLHLAAEKQHFDVLDILLTHGADINSRERRSGRTVLHHAAETDNYRLLYFLLQRPDVYIDAETYDGLTALGLAMGRGHSEVMRVLLARGACPDSTAC